MTAHRHEIIAISMFISIHLTNKQNLVGILPKGFRAESFHASEIQILKHNGEFTWFCAKGIYGNAWYHEFLTDIYRSLCDAIDLSLCAGSFDVVMFCVL